MFSSHFILLYLGLFRDVVLNVGCHALCRIVCNSECVCTWLFGMLALMPCAALCVTANVCALGPLGCWLLCPVPHCV
jgi:hypothetical protein